MRSDSRGDLASIEELTQLACRLGASAASIVDSVSISIEDNLADLCREPRCENYGLSANCPPHVSGPSTFRELLRNYQRALVFKIDVPSRILLSGEYPEALRVLHEIGSAIERSGAQMGYVNSKAFVGGCCKGLFCQDHSECRVLSEGGACRNPDIARPSMSGFGINVTRLMKAAGWKMERSMVETETADGSMGTLCGLVLIA